MKRHWMLGVVWLMACGAGSPTDTGDDSTLESPLAADDELADDDLSDTELASEFIASAGVSDEAAADDEATEASHAADDRAGEATEAAPGVPPVIVIGAGGQPWQPPSDGVVVWCHASVPLGCPAIEPAPDAGRLVVVARSAETGDFEAMAEPGVAVGSGAGPGTAAPGAPPAPGVPRPGATGDGAPAPTGPGSPRPPLPVELEGSLPPLPGTCVAITFTGAVSAGGAASDAAAPGEPVADEPVAGGAPLPALPGMPALPPPGGCVGVAFPAVPAPLPSAPPHAGAGPVGAPSPVPSGCIGVAFAAEGDPSSTRATPEAAVDPQAASMPGGAPMPGMPLVCAARPPQPGSAHPGVPAVPSQHPAPPAAPLPAPGAGVGYGEVHPASDGAAADEAGSDDVR